MHNDRSKTRLSRRRPSGSASSRARRSSSWAAAARFVLFVTLTTSFVVGMTPVSRALTFGPVVCQSIPDSKRALERAVENPENRKQIERQRSQIEATERALDACQTESILRKQAYDDVVQANEINVERAEDNKKFAARKSRMQKILLPIVFVAGVAVGAVAVERTTR